MNEKTEMMADMIKKLACLLIEQNDKLTLEQALATVFNSEIYGKVMNERTSFYTQSPRYVFSFLDEELTYIIHSGFISGYQNRYGDNLKPPTNVYHRMTA